MKTHFNNIFKRFNSTMNLKSFVFCDLETTGLPSMEYNRTKITEMCFTVVEADHLNLGIFPRVQNKLNICLNPKRLISPVASDLTGFRLLYYLNEYLDQNVYFLGLHNDLLEHQPEFDLNMATLILQYLGMHRPPICLVAHNGNRFDYPILRTQFEKVGLNLSKDILCIDSLEAFRALLISEPLAEQKEKDLKTKDNASKEIPFEFTDGYDDILNQVLDKLQESNQIVRKAWNNNETTPKKKKINCNEVQIRTKDASSISNKVAKHVASRSLNFG